MMLKSTGIVSNNTNMMPATNPNNPSHLAVKVEPVVPEAMDDESDSPIAGDPMLSSSLTSPQAFTIDEALNQY